MSDVPTLSLGAIGDGFLAVLEVTDGPASLAWCMERGIADRIGLGHQRAVPPTSDYAGATARWFFRSPVPVATRELAPGVVLRGDGVIDTADPWVWRKRLSPWPELPPWIGYAEAKIVTDDAENAAPADPDPSWNEAPLPPEPPRAVTDGNLARGDAPELGRLLLHVVRGDSSAEPVHDGTALWRYNDATGVWESLDEKVLYRIVCTFAGTPAGLPPKPLKLSDSAIRGAISAAVASAWNPGFFTDERAGIAFANGFATIDEGQAVLLPHAAEHRARYRLEYTYDPDARAEQWSTFLEEIWRDCSEDDRAGRIALIEEWIGAALLGLGTRYQKCMLLIGEAGANGKSTLLSVLRSLFPKTAVRSVGPQLWGNPFSLAELAGARLNVVNELPDADVVEGEIFKAVISGDAVQAQRKHKDPFDLISRAAQAFACNALPGTRDQSGGFWRRWAVLTFPRTFAESEQDRTLSERLRAELPAITAHVLRAVVRLVARGRYQLPESSDEALEEWREDSDQVRQWLRECCDENTAAETPLADLYPIYAGWSRAHGHRALASNKLAQRLRAMGLFYKSKLGRYYRVSLKAVATSKYRSAA
jgi:P4 family phage/plasmid primase-like protien